MKQGRLQNFMLFRGHLGNEQKTTVIGVFWSFASFIGLANYLYSMTAKFNICPQHVILSSALKFHGQPCSFSELYFMLLVYEEKRSFRTLTYGS